MMTPGPDHRQVQNASQKAEKDQEYTSSSEPELSSSSGPDELEASSSSGPSDSDSALPRSIDILARLAPLYFTCFLGRLTRALAVVSIPLYVLDLGGSAAAGLHQLNFRKVRSMRMTIIGSDSAKADVGILASLYGLGFMLANIPGGILLPLVGSKCCILLSCTCYALSAGICFVPHIAVLMASQFFLGLANSLSVLSQQTYIGSHTPTVRRGFALSMMGGLQRWGLMVGPSLGAFLQESVLGIHAVFFAQVACAGLAALVTVSCLSRAEEEATGKKSDKTSGILDAKDAIKENGGRLVRVLGLAFAVQCVRKGRELFFSLSGRESGISDMFIGQITALSFGIDALTSPLAGYLMDSYGRRIAGVASLSLHSLGLSILALHSVAAVVASAVLTGLGNGLGSGLLMTLGSDLAPAGPGRGAFLAVYRLLFNSMDFITPGVLGALTSFSSLQAAELTTGAVGLLGILWVLLCVPETLQKQEAAPQSKETQAV